jgi:hypothetical protein
MPAIKKRMRAKNGRTQWLCLELIEYLTMVSLYPFHSEIHQKDFLVIINSILNQGNSDEARQKSLYLIKFWAEKFKEQ